MLYSQGIRLESLGIPQVDGKESADPREVWRIFAKNYFLFRGTPTRLWMDYALSEVFGLTVRSRNDGSQFGAAFKSLAGGELKGMTKNLQLSREDVVNRMVAEAEARGGNAVLAMRFDTSEMGGNWTEICAYGTAVVIEPLG